MLNSAAAGWRLALRVVAYQAIATLATATACLMLGPPAALAALAGGGSMAAAAFLFSMKFAAAKHGTRTNA